MKKAGNEREDPAGDAIFGTENVVVSSGAGKLAFGVQYKRKRTNVRKNVAHVLFLC